MKKFRVLYERRETEAAEIEAETAEQAEQLANENYSDYDWKDIDCTMEGEILTELTEEINYD